MGCILEREEGVSGESDDKYVLCIPAGEATLVLLLPLQTHWNVSPLNIGSPNEDGDVNTHPVHYVFTAERSCNWADTSAVQCNRTYRYWCYVSILMLHIDTDVTYRYWCYISILMLRIAADVTYRSWCYVSILMLRIDTDVAYRYWCYVSILMLNINTDVTYRYWYHIWILMLRVSRKFLLSVRIKKFINHWGLFVFKLLRQKVISFWKLLYLNKVFPLWK